MDNCLSAGDGVLGDGRVTEVGEGVERGVGEEREGEEREAEGGHLGVLKEIEAGEDVAREAERALDDIPAIPAEEAAEIDAEGAEGEHAAGEAPTPDEAFAAADDFLHEEEGEVAEQEAGPGEGHHHDDVEPHGNGRTGLEMQEIGDDV